MSNANAKNTLDNRLKDCKHDRLRQAMQAHSQFITRPVVVVAPHQPARKPTPDVTAKPASRSKSYLGGAVATMVLAFSWFMMASYSAIDFSIFESDGEAGAIISCTSTASAPSMPAV